MSESLDTSILLDLLAEGLMDLDRHKWGNPTDQGRESLRPAYRRDAERFLLPYLSASSAGASS